MPRNSPDPARHYAPQKAAAPTSGSLRRLLQQLPDTISWWAEQYAAVAVATSAASRKVRQRDVQRFVAFMRVPARTDRCRDWTPHLSKAFHDYLRHATVNGQRAWSDRTIQRILAHVKTFARWVHHLHPFPLGNPMDALTLQALGTGLQIDRALTTGERRQLLAAADLLVEVGGRSTDRRRHRGRTRPRRKGYRALRNRAIIYTLVETGMRRAAVTKLNLHDVDFARGLVTVEVKRGLAHPYHISHRGLQAIRVYLDQERPQDAAKWGSPALFLSPATNPHGNGRLTATVINAVWNAVAERAGIAGKTPHSARHAMGKHIMEQTGNVAAVQRQLGHRHAIYAVQYARFATDALAQVINTRG